VYALDGEKCAGRLLLRNWRPGDRIQAVGRASTEKIKTLFQENRIPLWERRNWPVIVRDESVLWTRQFGAAGDFAAGPESRQILLVREGVVRETGESNPAGQASIQTARVS
jgi:tRNA(Ile)-lysidine synthase